MKRDPALHDLSSDHHSALVLARRIRQAVDAPGFDPAATWAEVSRHFHDELDPHFRKEERGLLPALRAVGEQALVERTRKEHQSMRALVERADPDDLLEFARQLKAHVRFEEQELFEVAQQRLSVDQLAAIRS